MFFGKGNKSKTDDTAYNKSAETPALKCSICTGETTAGFIDNATGKFRDVMLIRTPADLETFKQTYHVEELKKIY
ncbi:MAG: aspartate dehydrogenase [Clostridiales bacterium]|nr:aspartate dehydrogenase [Clostridiales bacterium]